MPVYFGTKKRLLVRAAVVSADTAPPTYNSGEAGDVGSTTIEITFSEAITSTDYAAGVTIKVNAVAATINSATRQDNQSVVHFVIAAAADIDDVITWEYDDAVGDYQDLAGNALADVAAQTCTNYIGSHLYFDEKEDSAHLAHV